MSFLYLPPKRKNKEKERKRKERTGSSTTVGGTYPKYEKPAKIRQVSLFAEKEKENFPS